MAIFDAFDYDGSGEIDLTRYYIDKYDSDNDETSSGALGVDEDIITALRRREHCESDQNGRCWWVFTTSNEAVSLATA